MDLSGRTVLVTGASSGIGRATAVLLSRLGARLALGGRDSERLERTFCELAGEGHVVAPQNLEQVEEIAPWMQALADRMGKLHGLVHCAGIQLRLPARYVAPADAERVMRVNWLAALELARAFRRKTTRSTPARIVFLASVAATVGSPSLSAYASSKGALLSLARSLALEFADEGITVNCVTPGIVRSEMTSETEKRMSPEQFARLSALHPLGLGDGSDVAAAVAYLLADTGRWITGASLVVDGGFSAGLRAG